MIIGVTGLARSGKDTVADYICEKHGFKKFDFYADVFLKELKKRNLEPTKMNASILGDELRKEHGQGVMAKLLLEKLDTDKALITGIRSPAEVEEIRKHGDFKLILVEAPREQRFARRKDVDPQDEEGFFARDENDMKKGLPEVFSLADYKIENSGSLEELNEKVEKFFSSLK